MSELASRLRKLTARTNGAKLVAVSKNASVAAIRTVYRAGQRDFAENRVRELQKKALELDDLEDVVWHFIGNLQTNKITALFKIPRLRFLHSVDSFRLLESLHRRESLLSARLFLFLQVNTSGERQKQGFAD